MQGNLFEHRTFWKRDEVKFVIGREDYDWSKTQWSVIASTNVAARFCFPDLRGSIPRNRQWMLADRLPVRFSADAQVHRRRLRAVCSPALAGVVGEISSSKQQTLPKAPGQSAENAWP